MSVVVVGSGIAGLMATLRVAELRGPGAVTLVTKASIEESNTRYAQGGVAAALSDDDSSALHVTDTLAVGVGLNDRRAVEIVCEQGPGRVRDLVERWGVPFDRNSSGELARGLEAAHSRPRVLHAGGDATGAAIVAALVEAVRASGVQVREHTLVTELVRREGAVAGVRVLGPGGREDVAAESVILATGGLGAVFAATTNPAVATGDGIALAWRAGAMLRDLEFVQFHPTALAIAGHFLISEAVRGEGAVLRDASGDRFMRAVHPLAELAPRDVVARGIARAMAAQGGGPVWLDATGVGDARQLAARFPTIDARVRAAGFDWSREPIPVTPAAHYAMGGVAVDAAGRTSVPGLYAVGEVASTGLHGANRLASNSLLEGLVTGPLAAQDAVRRMGDGPVADECWRVDGEAAAGAFVTMPPVAGGEAVAVDADTVRQVRVAIGEVLWRGVGVERSADGLHEAREALRRLAAALPRAPHTATEVEASHLALVAQLIAAAADARHESRGAHFRSDFPGADPHGAKHQILQNPAAASTRPLATHESEAIHAQPVSH